MAREITPIGRGRFLVRTGGRTRLAYAVAAGRDTWVFLDGHTQLMTAATGGRRVARGEDSMLLAAPMPATVVRVQVTPGQQVTRGDVLVLLEAMKMELPIVAPHDGRVRTVSCIPGELVQPGVALVELE